MTGGDNLGGIMIVILKAEDGINFFTLAYHSIYLLK